MKSLLKFNDLFGNECDIVLDKKPTNDTINFIDNYNNRKLTVFLIIDKQDTFQDFKISICNGYAHVKDKSLQIHEMSNCLIVFVQKTKFTSGQHKFKNWFNQALKTPHFIELP